MAHEVKRTFGSDNHAGVHPKILKWIEKVNVGDCSGYGEDPWTEELGRKMSELFGKKVETYLVFNGTAANILALRCYLKPYQAVICNAYSHLNTDECGAPEFFASSKLILTQSEDGKIRPEQIEDALDRRGDEHQVQPKLVSITQPTELGTLYSLDELKALSEVCRKNDLYLHMDGARISNAIVSLGTSFKEMVTDTGVNVLSFGGTKNGIMGAEALVILQTPDPESVKFLRKQSAQLASKMRFLSAQFLGLLEEDLWKQNAQHANEMARRLAEGVSQIPGVKIVQSVDVNAVFVEIPTAMYETLNEIYHFYPWPGKASKGAKLARWMTTFETSESEVETFLSHAMRISQSAGVGQLS